MATSVRASALGTSATGTALSVSAPTGTVAGDLVIIVITTNSGASTHTDNNGGTSFTKDQTEIQLFDAGGSTISIWSRRIQGGDPSTYNWTSDASDRWTVIAVTFQNPHVSVIYDVSPTGNDQSNGSGTTQLVKDITTLNNNSIHCAVAGGDTSGTTITGTPSSPYVLQQNGGTQVMAFATKIITPAGATGSQTYNFSVSVQTWSYSFAIRDEGTGGAPASGIASAFYRRFPKLKLSQPIIGGRTR